MFAGLKQQFLRTGAALPGRLFHREPQPAQRAGRAARAAKAVPSERGLRRFVRETRSELKKVVWPTREQTINLTAIVIAVSVAVGLIMGGIDIIFKTFFQLLLGAR